MSSTVTAAPLEPLRYPLGDVLPAPGAALEVAPGLRWVRMGLPFALDHVNLWLVRDGEAGAEGWAIVDCGIDDAPTRAAWQQVFEAELGRLPVRRVIVTHMHPDHIGLAHWLIAQAPGAASERRLWMSATDFHAAHLACRSTSGVGGEHAARFFARHGLTDAATLEQVRGRRDHFARLVPRLPDSFHRLMDGSELTLAGQRWACIAGYGHAPEHIALHAPALGVLISGDMVLPRISTNVSVSDIEPDANPLQQFLHSLERLRRLPADTLVLPSHGKPFVGLHARIDQLVHHHRERCAEVLASCATRPRSAADLLPVLFRRPLDLHQTTFAMGEAIAHLHFLHAEGKLTVVPGDDGVLRYLRRTC